MKKKILLSALLASLTTGAFASLADLQKAERMTGSNYATLSAELPTATQLNTSLAGAILGVDLTAVRFGPNAALLPAVGTLNGLIPDAVRVGGGGVANATYATRATVLNSAGDTFDAITKKELGLIFDRIYAGKARINLAGADPVAGQDTITLANLRNYLSDCMGLVGPARLAVAGEVAAGATIADANYLTARNTFSVHHLFAFLMRVSFCA